MMRDVDQVTRVCYHRLVWATALCTQRYDCDVTNTIINYSQSFEGTFDLHILILRCYYYKQITVASLD